MTEVSIEDRPAPPLGDPASAVRLRGDPPRVMRLSRKAIGIASACGFALVGGALIYALQPQGRKSSEELYNTGSTAVADGLAGAPKDYGQVPKLGPPLPGDLGKPILDAQRRGGIGRTSACRTQSCGQCRRSCAPTCRARARSGTR
jgi:type IV secretory pathway VirB10-like protein